MGRIDKKLCFCKKGGLMQGKGENGERTFARGNWHSEEKRSYGGEKEKYEGYVGNREEWGFLFREGLE